MNRLKEFQILQYVMRGSGYLYVLVFFTGAAVLAIETLAFRVVSPFFGNTIFSFSSIITVVLGALSVGYVRGGILADRNANYATFFNIIFWSGISVLLAFAFSDIILSGVFAVLPSLVGGPLLSAILLFFVPAFFLGMLSPYAIALLFQENTQQGIGHITGKVFAWSTMGSIAGSLLTGFVLVSFVGIRVSAIAIAVSLIVLGLVGYGLCKSTPTKKVLLKLVVAVFVGVFAFCAVIYQSDTLVDGELLFEHDGRYEKISVYNTMLYNQPTTLLLLDRTYSSAINTNTGALVFPYTTYYELFKLFVPEPDATLVLGGGSATVAKVLHDTSSATVDVVDIEPLLPKVAQKYFVVPHSDRINYTITDARMFLRTAETTYDFIFSDVYTSLHSVPVHVTTKEYYTLMSERLSDQGIAMFNIIGSLAPTEGSFLFSTYKTLTSVFPQVDVFAVQSTTSYYPQNFIVVARKTASEKSMRELVSQHPAFADRADALVDMSKYPSTNQLVYSDELAPVELHNSKLFHYYH